MASPGPGWGRFGPATRTFCGKDTDIAELLPFLDPAHPTTLAARDTIGFWRRRASTGNSG